MICCWRASNTSEDRFRKQHPEDVLLELRSIHLAAEDVRGCVEVTLELRKGEPMGTEFEPEVSVSVRVVIVLAVAGETIRLKLSVPDTLFCVA